MMKPVGKLGDASYNNVYRVSRHGGLIGFVRFTVQNMQDK